MKILAFTAVGTRRRQEDAYAIVEVPFGKDHVVKVEDSSNSIFADNTVESSIPEDVLANSEEDDSNNGNPSDYTKSQTRTFIVVADGMGGHDCGDLASYMVVKGMTDYWKGNPLQKDSPEKIFSAVKQTGAVYEQNTRGREMGSTMVMATFEGPQAFIAHCGDSRIYIWHKENNQFFHTNDHIRVSEFGWELVANAFFTGHCSEIDPEIRKEEFLPGDRIMLCTDGVFKFIPKDDLRKIFTSDADLSEVKEEFEAYCQAMARDNYTAVLVEF